MLLVGAVVHVHQSDVLHGGPQLHEIDQLLQGARGKAAVKTNLFHNIQ